MTRLTDNTSQDLLDRNTSLCLEFAEDMLSSVVLRLCKLFRYEIRQVTIIWKVESMKYRKNSRAGYHLFASLNELLFFRCSRGLYQNNAIQCPRSRSYVDAAGCPFLLSLGCCVGYEMNSGAPIMCFRRTSGTRTPCPGRLGTIRNEYIALNYLIRLRIFQNSAHSPLSCAQSRIQGMHIALFRAWWGFWSETNVQGPGLIIRAVGA